MLTSCYHKDHTENRLICGCVHKLNIDEQGCDTAVHKLLEINLRDFGSVFTNAWLLTGVIDQTILVWLPVRNVRRY